MIKSIVNHKAPKVRKFSDFENKQKKSRLAYPLEESPFNHIYVDLSHRCNMSCNICYNPIRTLPDMETEYFEECCRRLKKTVVFRFLGGEPTLNPKFFDFLAIAKKYGHLASVASNGLMYLNKDFVKEMKKYRTAMYGITMNGGLYNDDVYEQIDNARCASQKKQALENLLEANVTRVCLSGIVVRDLNEFILGEFIDLAKKYPKNIRFIKTRSIGKHGRFIESEPYSTNEFKKVLENYLPKESIYDKPQLTGTKFEPENGIVCRECCYHFRPWNGVQFSFVEFSSPQSRLCWRRGKLKEGNYMVESYFEDMSHHHELLDELEV